MTNSSMRKKRTRTLIQLGGLIEKSGILSKVGLQIGDDLQIDPSFFEGTAILMGALEEITQSLYNDTSDQQKLLWNTKGKSLLAKEA